MFDSVLNFFGVGDKPKEAAPAPAATPAPAAAPAPAVDHTPAPGQDHTSPATANASAAAAAPGADQSKPKQVDQKAMDAAANTIFKKMDGWWVSDSDKSTILDQLRGKSPEEIAAIKRSYAEQKPGHDLDADLAKHLDGKDLQEAKASETGDTVGAAVAAIKNAETGTWRGSVDSDRINTVLDSIKDPTQRAEVAKQVGGELSKLQSGNDSKLTQALLKGDTATASAVRIDTAQNSWTSVLAQGVNNGVFGGLLGKDFGTDKDAINKAIEDCKTPEDRAKLQQQYKLNTGTDLNKDLDKHLDGANRTVATKLLEGDAAGANAAKMKAATEHWFTDKDAIYKAMEGKSPAERKAMMADYKNMYGQDVDKMLDKELSGLDRDKAKELEQNGKLSDAFALKYAQEGSFWSTDKQLIKDTLAGKSKEEIAALSAEYKTKYGIDLQKELNDSTSGRDGFEINELMKGEPKTLDEKMARARERYDFERGSGSNIVSNAFNDAFSDKGKLLDQQQARAEELYKKIQSGQASPEEKALLDRVTGYQNLDTKNYQESKDAVTNGAVAVAAVTAGAIATVATGGAAAPAEAAIIAALAAGTATVGTKMVLQGSGYSREELRNDLIMTGVNMATGGTMGALGAEGGALFNLAAKASDNPIVQQALIQGVSGAVSTGVGNATQATLAGKDMKDVLKAGGMGVLTGGAGAATTGALGAGLKGSSMFEGMDPMKAAMLRNAIAGAGGAAVTTGLDPDSYNGDSAALLTKWGLSVGGGAVSGAAAGYNEGKVEVDTANKVAQENQRLESDGKLPPTRTQEDAITNAEKMATNPAEVKELEKVRQQLEQGKPVDVPVEQSPPGAAPNETKAAPGPVEEKPVTPVAPSEQAKTESGTPVAKATTETLDEAVAAHAATKAETEAPAPAKVEDTRTELQKQIDRMTGVDKGDATQRFGGDMAEFYRQQEIEAQNVTHVEYQKLDPRTDGSAYGINASYDARTFTYDNGNLTVVSMDVAMQPGAGVTPADIQQVQQNATQGMDQYYNFDQSTGARLHKLPNGDRLQVEINHVADPAQADLVVKVEQPGPGKATVQNEWITNNAGPTTAAHELTHQLGAPDEYVDHNKPASVARETPASPGVHTDGSLMGNYNTDGLPTEVKQRTIDMIGNDIDAARAGTTPKYQQLDGKAWGSPAPELAGPVVEPPVAASPAPVDPHQAALDLIAKENGPTAFDPLTQEPTEFGHGHDAHGFQTTQDQQATRVETGLYPQEQGFIGPLTQEQAQAQARRMQNPAREASRFGSAEQEAAALTQGRAALEAEIARRQAARAKKGQTWDEFDKNGDPLTIPVKVRTADPAGFGPPGERVVTGTPDVTDPPLLDGNGQRQSETKTSGPSMGAHIAWKWVPNPPPMVGGEWRPYTYYPED
ncbi:MAG: hypothetical protein ACM31C_12545 [Acidobacteriota bacterium]